MKNKIPNALLVWKQFEDVLAPRLGLSTADRAVYSYLLRHSRLEGKRRFRFKMPWMARSMGVCKETGRCTVRRLANLGALHLIDRSSEGHLVEVRLPSEIRAFRPYLHKGGKLARQAARQAAADLEKLDFFQDASLRRAIYARERRLCFYCLRRTSAGRRCLDHVVPRAKSGLNCYRNLVCCCMECNSLKGERSAADHLSRLYREDRLTDAQLAGRFRALNDLGRKTPPAAPHVVPWPHRGLWDRDGFCREARHLALERKGIIQQFTRSRLWVFRTPSTGYLLSCFAVSPAYRQRRTKGAC